MISPDPGSYILEAVMSTTEGPMVHMVNEDNDLMAPVMQIGQVWIQAVMGDAPPKPFLLIEIEG